MDIVENRGFANEDIENLEDKGPCAEPATATIREDVDGSADPPCYVCPYFCKLFVGATCVKIHISKSGHCKEQSMKRMSGFLGEDDGPDGMGVLLEHGQFYSSEVGNVGWQDRTYIYIIHHGAN